MKKLLYLFSLITLISSCKKDVEGCMNDTAFNYNVDATIDDESCVFDTDGDGIYDSDEIIGCQDSLACTFNSDATDNDESCEYSEYGFDCDGYVLLEIGEAFQGGILFYIDETGQHGLVAAVEDLTEGVIDTHGLGYNGYEWGCYQQIVVGADGMVIGTGLQNTLDIVSDCPQTPIAASEALNVSIDGFTDWYLPSIDELIEMYNSIGNGGPDSNIGGFETEDFPFYWSSSEYANWGAWGVSFSDGNYGASGKSSGVRVRIIRAF